MGNHTKYRLRMTNYKRGAVNHRHSHWRSAPNTKRFAPVWFTMLAIAAQNTCPRDFYNCMQTHVSPRLWLDQTHN